MKPYTMIPVVLALASSSFAGFRIHSSIGGMFSTMKYAVGDSTGITVTDQEARGLVLFGAAAEVDFRETIGLTIGMQLEDRGGLLKGNATVPLFGMIDGGLDFRYRHLQFPLQVKFIIPLLIPGSIYLSGGPELGFLIDHSYTLNDTGNFPVLIFNIDSLTAKTDFGISGTAGYELPLGRHFAMSIWGSYYYGFTDLYENTDRPSMDLDLFNRALRFGVSLITTLKEF
ncbi:MAG: outer membrane beta-barrel protein [Chitinispirillaceae bacterium]|nr:outer membrane beta-barrel protein [Chitinispirillaceae bacterium]